MKTICVTNRDAPVTCYVLNAGGAIKTIDVPAKWEAGVIWGFNGNSGSVSLGIAAKPQANLAEITVGAADGNDYYDISNVVRNITPINHSLMKPPDQHLH